MKIEFILAVLLTVTMLIGLPHTLAYNVGYQSINQPVFTRIPTVCAELPSDFPTSQGQLDLYMQTIQDRVSEWSNRLSEGATSLNEWKINYVEVDPNKEPNFNSSSCDILVALQAYPHDYSSNGHSYWGYEEYGGGQRLVVVYYEYYQNCGPPPTYSGYACPTGTYATIPDLSNTILHELGHALGLGHYVSDDPNMMYAWTLDPYDVPSIMVPYDNRENTQYRHITELDVQQIHKMYNYKGFLAFAPTSGYDPFETVTAKAYLTNVNGDQTPVVDVMAQISPEYYNRGDPIYIEITDSQGNQIYNQDFLTTGSFSQTIIPQGLVSGTYTLNAVYDGMKSPDVNFVFSYTPSLSFPTSPQSLPPQAQTTITVTTDKTSYSPGDSLAISGTVNPAGQGQVSAVVSFPSNSNQAIFNITPNSDGIYSTTIPNLSQSLPLGTYTVTATYSGASSQTTFSFSGRTASVTVQTDKSSYSPGDNLRITGTVNPVQRGQVSLRIIFPNDQSAEFLVTPDASGTFSKVIPNLISNLPGGKYAVTAAYADVQSQTTFSFDTYFHYNFHS